MPLASTASRGHVSMPCTHCVLAACCPACASPAVLPSQLGVTHLLDQPCHVFSGVAGVWAPGRLPGPEGGSLPTHDCPATGSHLGGMVSLCTAATGPSTSGEVTAVVCKRHEYIETMDSSMRVSQKRGMRHGQCDQLKMTARVVQPEHSPVRIILPTHTRVSHTVRYKPGC